METIIKWTKCSEELPKTMVDGCMSIDQYLVLIKVGNEYHVDVGYNWGTYIDDFWDTLHDWIEEEECHVMAWAPWPDPFKEKLIRCENCSNRRDDYYCPEIERDVFKDFFCSDGI